jgi:hypothetical protein
MLVGRHVGGMLACTAIAVTLLVPAVACAAETGVDFTLPPNAMSGCMVCHGDPSVGRLQGSEFVSYWIDGEKMGRSAHGSVDCTGCHLEFGYGALHAPDGQNWAVTAKLACRNCHEEQWVAYGTGVHAVDVAFGQAPSGDDVDKPLCGDCHGSHDIMSISESEAARAALHARGGEMCGGCHEEYWDNYADYYHGSAYRRGAADAPVCWRCHSWHETRSSDDPASTMHVDNLVETCGQCHEHAGEGYVGYAGTIHRQQEFLAGNPVYSLIKGTRESIGEFFGTIRSWLLT